MTDRERIVASGFIDQIKHQVVRVKSEDYGDKDFKWKVITKLTIMGRTRDIDFDYYPKKPTKKQLRASTLTAIWDGDLAYMLNRAVKQIITEVAKQPSKKIKYISY